MHTFQFNPEDQNLIVAGCANGQIALWDISAYQDKLRTSRKATDKKEDDATNVISNLAGGGLVGTGGLGKFTQDKGSSVPRIGYLLCSSIEFSHRGAITDLNWLPKNGEVNSS